jgi:hypothetical protein
MLRKVSLLFAAMAAVPVPLLAQGVVVSEQVFAEETVVDDAALPASGGSERFVAGQAAQGSSGGISGQAFGPFRVLDEGRAALVGTTDERSPDAFAAMLAAHPKIGRLELVECPGTFDDRANLRLGRMIRARGIATHVPEGGSVRSGAVELFLAGVRRSAEQGAEFAVHAWEDEDGREATDYAESAPENRAYLDYYREMGMSAEQARAFYAMTNSVPFNSARWMTAAEMAQWARYD